MIPGLNQTSVKNYLKNIYFLGKSLTRFCHPTVLLELKRNQQKQLEHKKRIQVCKQCFKNVAKNVANNVANNVLRKKKYRVC